MGQYELLISGAFDTEQELGALYSKDSTTFRLWAPTAERVVLNRYAKGSSAEEGDAVIGQEDMEKLLDTSGEWTDGVWEKKLAGDLAGTYYTYSVTVDGVTRETMDPNAKAAGVSGWRSMVVDLRATDPEGFSEDRHVCVEQATDAVVWEVHVKDFSSDPKAGFEAGHRGKYLAFTDQGTKLAGTDIATGVDYLKELGVNYVQLLPVFDQLNDETKDFYNWGYEPLNYNVPDGLYSTNPYDGAVRIREFKEMVMALHAAGIGVIMDVVFNHMSDAATCAFHMTVPGYYFRMDPEGDFYSTGTACGNETASERGMFRRFMIESILYWTQEYHIDGFRFDLMGCHDIETMNRIREELDKLEGGDKILVYGEPWSAGLTHQPEGVEMAVQANISKLHSGVGAFNDVIRDAVKGHVFYNKAKGFVQGGNGKPQPEDGAIVLDEALESGIQANANPDYSNPWAKAPVQTTSYISCHDNLALYDKLVISVKDVTVDRGDLDGIQADDGIGIKGTPLGDPVFYERDEELVRMNKLAAAAYLTAQGKVFFQAGEEFARSKGGDENSYNTALLYENGREWNQINWSRRESFADLNAYYKGLLALRKSYAPFRAADLSAIQNMSFSQTGENNLVAYTITSPGEKWDMVAVILNGNETEQKVALTAKEGVELPAQWGCVVDQETAGAEPMEGVSFAGSEITVPAQSALVLVGR